jgi:hypothetical protein
MSSSQKMLDLDLGQSRLDISNLKKSDSLHMCNLHRRTWRFSVNLMACLSWKMWFIENLAPEHVRIWCQCRSNLKLEYLEKFEKKRWYTCYISILYSICRECVPGRRWLRALQNTKEEGRSRTSLERQVEARVSCWLPRNPYYWYNIKFISLSNWDCRIQWLLAYSQYCTIPPLSNSEHFHHPKDKACIYKISHSPFRLTSSPWQSLIYGSMGSSALDILY